MSPDYLSQRTFLSFLVLFHVFKSVKDAAAAILHIIRKGERDVRYIFYLFIIIMELNRLFIRGRMAT